MTEVFKRLSANFMTTIPAKEHDRHSKYAAPMKSIGWRAVKSFIFMYKGRVVVSRLSVAKIVIDNLSMDAIRFWPSGSLRRSSAYFG